MKVAINSFPLKSGHTGRGIGFYTSNLIESLKKIKEIEVIEFDKLSSLKGVDLVHYPYFDLFKNSLPFSKKFPTVVTIHDVTPLIFPDYYPPGVKGGLFFKLQKLSVRGVQAVITDSQNSKKDIIKYLEIPSKKIHVIPLSFNPAFKPVNDKSKLEKIRSKYNLPQKFVLFVGSVNWNKNILNLSQACIDAGVDLVLVGKDFEKKTDLNHPELKSFKEFKTKFQNNPLIHITGFVEMEDIVAIYNLASVLALPSFYEGFGFPILEAQAVGIPVITSNVSSMKEVAGEGALFVSPESANEITEAINKIMQDEKVREGLIKKGFINVKNYSWEKVAEQTAAIYKQVID